MRSLAVAILVTNALLLMLLTPSSLAGRKEEQICDVPADYFLGLEDYREAILLHVDVLTKHPRNALAHYHLGFALGMLGDTISELREYQQAEALGLANWDLFLNLGLVELETGDLKAATDSLRRAVRLDENRFESHFNLALVEEQRGMLAKAEQETLASLASSPKNSDALNLLGVIYAEEGKTARASEVWSQLGRDLPDYEPVRANLKLLAARASQLPARRRSLALHPVAAIGAY